MKRVENIYADHASITPIDPEVIKTMLEVNRTTFANPSSIHSQGVKAKAVLEQARKDIAESIKAQPNQIIFTSGGTESNNLAISGFLNAQIKNGRLPKSMHMLISAVEHPSVMEVAQFWRTRGVMVETVSVDSSGRIDLKDLKNKLQKKTVLVSLMLVNNEIGVVEPVKELAKLIRHACKTFKNQIAFHVDACHAPIYLPIDTRSLGADLVSIDGQKMMGPRGVGILYKKNGIEIEPLFFGGGQESGLRSGTEVVSNAAGLARAFKLADARRDKRLYHMRQMKSFFIKQVQADLKKDIIFNSQQIDTECVPHIINISFPGIDVEFLLLQLDAAGIACSTKSSCLSGQEYSYVLRALGRTDDQAKSSLRFSFAPDVSKKELMYCSKVLAQSISKQFISILM